MANADPVSPKGFKVDHIRVRYSRTTPGKYDLEDIEDSTIQTVLDDLETGICPGAVFEVFFLPPVHAEDEYGGLVLSSYPDLCHKLATALRVEPSFLTKDAWNSNGFSITQRFRYEFECNSREGFSTASRFLVKLPPTSEQLKTFNEPEAAWLRLAFCSLLFSTSPRPTPILVCFDDCKRIKSDIIEGFRNHFIFDFTAHHLVMYDFLLRRIIWKYEQGVDGLQKLIRDTKKERRSFKAKICDLDNMDSRELDNLIHAYDEVCELSRQASHMRETLQAAVEAVQAVASSIVRDEWSTTLDQISNGLKYSTCLLNNLKFRLDTHIHILDLEIKSVDTIVGVYQLQSLKRLLTYQKT
ncbi:hypothetical protein F5Y04DRAFT_255949 [Hypomontagnella monticulosa]|nr:hypothetical protein F5Y04DRAFT_255949 [Hypomontagnella monticulosa]